MIISSLIDRIIETIKWPLAIASILMLPFSLLELRDSGIVSDVFSYHQAILIGFAAYILAWLVYFKKDSAGSFFSTFEHELTHAVFAWITFKRVSGLFVDWRAGGYCKIDGGMNWLIYIAPYFFPTLMIVPIALSFIVKREYFEAVQFLLGAVLAYHVTSTYEETHTGQTDLQETSFLFALLFLPTANIMIYGTALIYFVRGYADASDYVVSCWSETWHWVTSFI
ncbi:MAG TPA: hypothetical protein DEQ32_09385 [Gammaproteobacteria bacterium]|nr:hypothetical protein [Gammaproteobacteria bacterium]